MPIGVAGGIDGCVAVMQDAVRRPIMLTACPSAHNRPAPADVFLGEAWQVTVD
jgi:hypothetical protein